MEVVMYRNLDFKTLSNEVWKAIPSFEGSYEVSNLGRVKTLIDRKVDKRGRVYSKKPKIMKQSFTSTGYLMVNLNKKPFKVHRLVAQAFIPNYNNYPFINHKDNNPLNNRVENLEWCTPQYNLVYSIENGHHLYKRDYIDKDDVVLLYNNNITVSDIAKKYNVSKIVIYGILRKQNCKIYKKSRYNIDLDILKSEFDSGMSNSELVSKYKCNQNLIARRRYQYKKGEI
jgi:Mor family transcriptional regulator